MHDALNRDILPREKLGLFNPMPVENAAKMPPSAPLSHKALRN